MDPNLFSNDLSEILVPRESLFDRVIVKKYLFSIINKYQNLLHPVPNPEHAIDDPENALSHFYSECVELLEYVLESPWPSGDKYHIEDRFDQFILRFLNDHYRLSTNDQGIPDDQTDHRRTLNDITTTRTQDCIKKMETPTITKTITISQSPLLTNPIAHPSKQSLIKNGLVQPELGGQRLTQPQLTPPELGKQNRPKLTQPELGRTRQQLTQPELGGTRQQLTCPKLDQHKLTFPLTQVSNGQTIGNEPIYVPIETDSPPENKISQAIPEKPKLIIPKSNNIVQPATPPKKLVIPIKAGTQIATNSGV